VPGRAGEVGYFVHGGVWESAWEMAGGADGWERGRWTSERWVSVSI
jgi:hypothetical protein